MRTASTAPTSEMTDEEFEKRTLDVIQREWSLRGLARFLMTFRSDKGGYTAERQARTTTLQWLTLYSL